MSAEIIDNNPSTTAPPSNRITNLDPDLPPKKPLSPKKLSANRRNAQKSTGPRTPEGKKTVSQNARKHGCSQSALLETECDATYEIFAAELDEDLRPRTALQNHLASQISQILWKLQRIQDAERQLYELNQTDADQPACQTLAQAFHQSPTKNDFLLFERYQRQLRTSYLRLLTQLRTLQKDPLPTYEERYDNRDLPKARQAIQDFLTSQTPPAQDAHFNLCARLYPCNASSSPIGAQDDSHGREPVVADANNPAPSGRKNLSLPIITPTDASSPPTTNHEQQTPLEIKPTETPLSASESPIPDEKFPQTNPPAPIASPNSGNPDQNDSLHVSRLQVSRTISLPVLPSLLLILCLLLPLKFLDAAHHTIYAPSIFVDSVTWEARNMCKSARIPSFALAMLFTVSVSSTQLWAQADAAKPDAAKPDAPKPDAPKPNAAAPAPAPAPAPNAAAAPANATEEPAINADLKQASDDFFHYASIGRYDLAKAAGEKIIALNADPMEVYRAFQATVEDRNRRVTPERRIELYERILSWQRQADLKDVGAKLISIFNQATYKQRSNTGFIESQVQRLSGGPRAYALAVEQLKTSGELAVPVMLSYLRDPSRRELQVPIRNALKDMGVKALNPLLAATDMKDPVVLPWVISALGDLGYDNAIPYLVRVLKSSDTPEAIKEAARSSLLRLNVTNPASLDPAQLFFELAEKFYYEKASVQPDKGSRDAFIWTYTNEGLMNKTVPAATFNEDMTLRQCEYCLKLNAARGDAVSLWIDAGYKRESEIPEGQTDTFWEEKHPATHYYAVASGTAHLNPALARALRDRNSAVALRAIRSLNEIVGATNLFAGDESPLIDGLHYGDRQVRIESALAIAQALPQKNFPGQERVIPVLAEAISQTGRPGVLILAPTDRINALREQLKNYAIAGGQTPETAASAAASLSAVDVVLMYEEVSNVDSMLTIIRQTLRLERAAKLIVARASKVASPFAQLAINDPTITVTDPNPNEAALNAAIEEARKRAGGLPMDEKIATGYALRAAEMLQRLAISKGQVFDLLSAQPAVMAALDDPRPEIAHAAANSLGLLNSREAQSALATKAFDEKTQDEFKIILLKDLSVHAKFYGNMLDQGSIENLGKLAETAANLDVKSAAAEALGALNLRSDQIKALIVNQAR